jgi:hypothetical protein
MASDIQNFPPTPCAKGIAQPSKVIRKDAESNQAESIERLTDSLCFYQKEYMNSLD